jgi:predicted Zn-dependent peptidase
MKRRCELPFFALLGLILAFSLPPFAACAIEQRLGERLYFVRDQPGTPTQFRMIVGAGCNDEAGGECRGLAHYLEHLLLVGRNPEHKEIALRFFPDATSNGWTSQRATVYVHTMPAREQGPRADLEQLFAFYAARLKDFAISDADAERERNVVRQEHDWRIGSKPFARLARKLDRLLVPDHPSGQWGIGTTEDIDGFTVGKARDFHRAWYAVNNVDFVIMADIDPAALKEIASRALAGLEPRALPPRAFAKQPAIVNGRTDIVEQDGTIQRPGVFFKKLVRIEEEDSYATGAARSMVTSFLTSRLPGSLYDVIVDQAKLAAGAPAVNLGRIAPKTFTLTIGADAAPDVAPETLLAAIAAYVEQLAPAGISAETLNRLKTRAIEGRAAADRDPRIVYNRLVNWLAARNRYERLVDVPQRIAAVSSEQVAIVLTGLSGPGRIVTGTLVAAADRRP